MNYFAGATLAAASNDTTAWARPCDEARFAGPCFYQLFDFARLRQPATLGALPLPQLARLCVGPGLGSEHAVRGCAWGLSWHGYTDFDRQLHARQDAGRGRRGDEPPPPPQPPQPPLSPSLVAWCSVFVDTSVATAAAGQREALRWLACVSGAMLSTTFVVARDRVPRAVVERHCAQLAAAPWPPSAALRLRAERLCVRAAFCGSELGSDPLLPAEREHDLTVDSLSCFEPQLLDGEL